MTNHMATAYNSLDTIWKSYSIERLISVAEASSIYIEKYESDGMAFRISESCIDSRHILMVDFLDCGDIDSRVNFFLVQNGPEIAIDTSKRSIEEHIGRVGDGFSVVHRLAGRVDSETINRAVNNVLTKVLQDNMQSLCNVHVMIMRAIELHAKEEAKAAKKKKKQPEPSYASGQDSYIDAIESNGGAGVSQYLLFDDDMNLLLVKSLANILMNTYTFKTIIENEKVLVYDKGRYVMNGERIIRKEVQRILGERSRKSYGNEVVYYIRNETGISIDEINKVEERCKYINVRNGIVEIATRKLLPHTPDYLTTIQINANYDPQVTCPNFMNFISGVVSEDTKEEDKTTLIEGLALCCVPVNVRRALLLIGVHANNGKSTLLEYIDELIGKENVSNVSPTAMQNEPYAAASMYGKAVNKDDDIPSDMLEETETFKKATTHGVIRAREIYSKPFDFKCTAFNVFATNKPPAIPTDDNNRAFFRRWQIVDFPVRFYKPDEYPDQKDIPREDPTIPQKIRTESEKSGVLNLIVEAARNLIAKKDFTYGQSSEDVKELYMAKSNPVFAFVEKYVQFEDDIPEPIYITKADFHAAFMAFVEKVDVGINWSQSRLTGQLNKDKQHDFKERGFVVTAGAIRNVPCFRGVTLNERFKDDFKAVNVRYYTIYGTIHNRAMMDEMKVSGMGLGLGPIQLKKKSAPDNLNENTPVVPQEPVVADPIAEALYVIGEELAKMS